MKRRKHKEKDIASQGLKPGKLAGGAAPFDSAQGGLSKSCPNTKQVAERSAAARSHLVEIEKSITIEKPIYGGAFLAHIEGKAVFVPLVMPGEHARVRVVEDKRGYSTAEVEEIVSAAPERIAPACPHFGACGGCSYQHTDYATQLALKRTILRETLERGGVRAPEEISVLSADPWAYRNRIRVAFDAESNPGYRGRRSHAVVPIAECPIAAPLLVRAALAAADTARKIAPALRPSGLSLFSNADGSALLASIFTTGAAKLRFDDFASALRERIPPLQGTELVLEGGRNEQPRTLARWGATCLTYRAAGFDYRVDHGAFFQVNRWLIDALVDRVAAGRSGALAWDLFAGVGLFARQLTARFDRVVAVESAPSATAALAHNLSGAGATAVKADALAFLRRSAGVPTDRSSSVGWSAGVPTDRSSSVGWSAGVPNDRSLSLGWNANGPRPDLIVADPPRTGLGAEITAQLARIAAPALVYVSCDPATLARDLRALIGAGYVLRKLTLADLFPQTFHLETVAELHKS